MKKFLFLAVAALCTSLVATAVPAKRTPVTFTQSDGTVITVTMCGDEWHHGYVTSDGLAVARAANGNFYYNTASGISTVMAHDLKNRNAAEQSYVAANRSQFVLGATATATSRQRARSAVASRRKVQVPPTGSPRIPILLVQYSDKKMSHDKADFEAHYAEGQNSVYQYFYDQSNGKYSPQFDIYGIYTLGSKRSTYGGNDSSGNDVGVAKMVGEAVDSASAAGDIDWSRYDNDGDGYADVVIVVYAGVGEAQASTTVPSSVWPCQWNLSEGAYYGDGTGVRTYNNTKVDKFAVFNEITGSSDYGTTLDGIGTFCHEFSHCLGLPDFYETTYGSGYYGMGSWSLMDYGCYNDDGNTPCGYDAYEKNFMGWVNLLTPTPNTHYTLPVWNKKSESTDVAYKVVSDVNSNEYFIVENRARQGWDRYIPDAHGGALITHVSYIPSRWDANTVNNYSVQLMTISPADNTLSSYTENADLYGTSNTEFTDNSSPAAVLYLTSSGSASGKAGYLGKPMTEFTIASDSTVSFWYMKEALKKTLPVLTAPSQVTDTSFTAHWTPALNAKEYTLYVCDTSLVSKVTKLLTEDFSTGTTKWTSTGTYSETGYLRLGSSRVKGSVTSPAVDLSASDGVTTVVVTAKRYNNDANVPMKVSVVDVNGIEIESKTFTLGASNADYTAVLTGKASAGNMIKIESTTAKKRVMLKQAVVYAGDASSSASGAPLKAVVETGDSAMRTITGITDTLYNVAGLVKNGTFLYRVKAIYTDGTVSEWSTAQQITLGQSALAGDVDENGIVDVSDVSALINVILGTARWTNTDINGDGLVNVGDVSSLNNIILNNSK